MYDSPHSRQRNAGRLVCGSLLNIFQVKNQKPVITTDDEPLLKNILKLIVCTQLLAIVCQIISRSTHYEAVMTLNL